MGMSLTDTTIKTKLGIHILFSMNTQKNYGSKQYSFCKKKHKHPHVIYLASSETGRCRATKLGNVIKTYNSDDAYM